MSSATTIVTSDASLHAMIPEWQALWQRTPGATAFQSPAWLMPWWRVFGTGRALVVRLDAAGVLAGLLPLYLLAEARSCKLLPMGVGASDYFDALVAPDAPHEAAAMMLRVALAAGFAGGASVCDLVELPPDAWLRPLGRATSGETCPLLTIAGGSAEASVPPRQRRKLRMNRNRAARQGGVTVEAATPATLEPQLAALFRWHAGRWGGQDDAMRQLISAAAPGLLAAGLLRLARLRIGGQDAACCLALTDASRRLMFYMIGFDPARADVSPGSLLIAAMIDAAVAEGCTEVHFLRGGEAYKYAWGAEDRHNAALRFEA